MSQGKENSSSLLSKISKMVVRKPGVTRSGRPSTSRYAVDEGARVGRGGGCGGGRGGGRDGVGAEAAADAWRSGSPQGGPGAYERGGESPHCSYGR